MNRREHEGLYRVRGKDPGDAKRVLKANKVKLKRGPASLKHTGHGGRLCAYVHVILAPVSSASQRNELISKTRSPRERKEGDEWR